MYTCILFSMLSSHSPPQVLMDLQDQLQLCEEIIHSDLSTMNSQRVDDLRSAFHVFVRETKPSLVRQIEQARLRSAGEDLNVEEQLKVGTTAVLFSLCFNPCMGGMVNFSAGGGGSSS